MKKDCELKYGWDEQSEKIALELIKRNKECKDLIKKLKKARISLNKKEKAVKVNK